MFRHLRGARAVQSQVPDVLADEQAVRVAEAIVARAWAEELFRRRESIEAAVTAAREGREAAHRRLAGALRDGDPRKISLAQAALERALEVLRRSELTRDHVHQSVQAELNVLVRARRQRIAAAAATTGSRPWTVLGSGSLAMTVWRIYQWLGRLPGRGATGPNRRRPP